MKLYHATKSNNDAVALFQRGHHELAVGYLTKAANQLVLCLTERQCDANYCSSQGGDLSEAEPLSVGYNILISVPVGQTAAAHENSLGCAMYNRAILLSNIGSWSQHTVTRASVSVLYNIAFFHHWRAFHSGIYSGMIKALQMYSKILVRFRFDDHPPDMEIVLLAVWNNMGHIYFQLLQFYEAQVCFNHLRRIMIRRADIRCRMLDQDYNIFQLNAAFKMHGCCIAPAA